MNVTMAILSASRCGSSILHFSQGIRFPTPFLVDEFALSRSGFLDTFDPFDSSCTDLPGHFLDLAGLSFASLLVRDLPLEKSAIA
jgi:hypothetical protein